MKDGFISALHRMTDVEVITETTRLRSYESDGLSAIKGLPKVVVIPSTMLGLQALVRLASEWGVPLVARGAGTGLSGGATPHPDGVLVSLAKFREIVSIDVENRRARVQPGVTNLAISEAVSEHGLFYAPDPSSQIACTIGGNVAENSGGVHCVKYGLTLHNVTGLEVMLMSGERISIGYEESSSHQPDLLALLHGSEGMLGVITEVEVLLTPKPEAVAVILAAFREVSVAADAVGAIFADGLVPAGLEMMDRLAIQAAEAFVHAGYPLDAEAMLLIELDGTMAEISSLIEKTLTILERQGAYQSNVERSEEGRARLWMGRKAAFPAVGRISPDYYCMDGTIPRRHLAEVLERIGSLSEQYGLRVANVFHAGDGNLHPLILFDANIEGELERAEAFGADILTLCIEFGGTITGEHGVGLEKINQMCVQFDAAALEIFHGVKAVFDEQGLLNPGKAVPTLSRCAEFGAMHVHKGQMPHPHLERF